MAKRYRSKAEGDDEDDYVKHATVVILDNGPSMFETATTDEYCDFANCLEALYRSLEKHFFTKWNSQLRIQFLDGRQNGTFFDLSTDLVEIMKKLQEVKDNDTQELKAVYCSDSINNEVVYESVLDAVDCLRKKTKDKHTKSVVILTNNADCHNCDADNDDLERVVEMMRAARIELIVLPLVNNFKWATFYGKLVQKVMDGCFIEDMISEGFGNSDDLIPVLDNFVQPEKTLRVAKFFYGPEDNRRYLFWHLRKAFKKKKLYHNAKVDPKTMRPVRKGKNGKFYLNVSHKKVLKKRKINPKSQSSQAQTSSTTQAQVDPSTQDTERQQRREKLKHKGTEAQNKKLTPYRKLCKIPQFRNSVKRYGQPGTMRLLYLCEKQTSPHRLNRQALIVEPHLNKNIRESETQKQLRLFLNFWKHCHENNKVMICRYVGQRRQKYYLMQLEPKITNGYKYFLGQYLSFTNGVKKTVRPVLHKIFEKNMPSGKDLTIAKEIIKKITVPDSSRAFQIENRRWENKAALIKGYLLSTKEGKWEPPEANANYPTQEDICTAIKHKRILQFKEEYMKGLMYGTVKKRRAPPKK